MTQDNTVNRTMDTFGNEDMALPELKLVQNVGGEEAKASGAKPGDLFCNLTGEIYKPDTGLKIVIIDVVKQRTYWGRTGISDEPPECSSQDGLTSIFGAACKECQYHTDTPWAIEASERRKYCTLHYNILSVNYESGLPLLIRTTGNSAKAIRELISALRYNKQLKGEIHRAIIKVSSRPHKSLAGDSFAFDFKPAGVIAEEAKAKEMLQLTVGLIGTQIAIPEHTSDDVSSDNVAPVIQEAPRGGTAVKSAFPPSKTLVPPEHTEVAPLDLNI